MIALNKENLSKADEKLLVSATMANKANHRLVHLGIGNFHRAHQALFTELANELGGDKWSITGVSFNSSRVRDALAGQDFLYSVSERDTNGQSFRLISCVENVLVAPHDPQAVIDCIADAATKVVSTTVTEKGYCQKSGRLDQDHPAIKAELEGAAVTTMPGYMLQALKKRMDSGAGKLTVISCDNLPDNGAVLEGVILDYASLTDAALKQWVTENVSFCSTMVDRIVPATTPEVVSTISDAIGLHDNGAVLCEPFKQWVIEDNFATPVPAWDKVGATFTSDVESYEKLKLRVLNGCHSLIAYCGVSLGDQFIHETVARPQVNAFVKAIMLNEMTKSLEVTAGVNVEEYCALILSRFENQHVPYLNAQVGTDGTLKLPQRIVFPMLDLLDRDRVPSLTPLVLAIWAGAMQSVVEAEDHPVKDPQLDLLAGIYKDTAPNELIKTLLAVVLPTGVVQDRLDWIVQTVQKHFDEVGKQGLVQYLSELGLS